MSFASEFETVDMILGSQSETRGVDAFALTLIKAERQVRKLFTHLAFQAACFRVEDVPAMREILAANKRVFFDGFVAGLEVIAVRPPRQLIGPDFDHLFEQIRRATAVRNKIFHGQLTNRYLTRSELLEAVADIRTWCQRLAISAQSEFGYDGFGRDSFKKSELRDWNSLLRVRLLSLNDYDAFIREHMTR